MSFAILFLMVLILGVASVAGAVGFILGRRRLPPPAAPQEDRWLADQVARLEDELQRVRDQADFTERLLAERGGGGGDDADAGNARG